MNSFYVIQECSLRRLQMFSAQEQPICVIQLMNTNSVTNTHHEFQRLLLGPNTV